MGIVTPTELKPLNQEIQWGIQTPGTQVQDSRMGHIPPRVPASPRPRVSASSCSLVTDLTLGVKST